jgi:MFS family permease
MSPRQPSFRALFALVGALVLIEIMFYAALAPLLPYYTRHLHLSKSAAGLLTASYAIGTLVFAVPLGLVVARIGVKRATVAGSALLACASVVFGFGRSIEVLDGARLIQGIAGAAMWIGAITWVVDAAPADRKGETVGAVLGIGVAGALLGPVVGSAAQLTAPKLVFGLVGAVIASLAAWAVSTPGPADEVQRIPPRRALVAATGDRRIWSGIWFTLLPALLLGILDVLAPLRLDALGAGAVAIGAVFLVSALIEAAASPFFGRLADRRGPLPLIRIGLVGAALFAVLLPLPDSAWLAGAVTALAGVAVGIAWVPANALLREGTEDHDLHASLAFALWVFGWAAGVSTGAALGAPLAQASSDAIAYGLVGALCVASLLALRLRQRIAMATT